MEKDVITRNNSQKTTPSDHWPSKTLQNVLLHFLQIISHYTTDFQCHKQYTCTYSVEHENCVHVPFCNQNRSLIETKIEMVWHQTNAKLNYIITYYIVDTLTNDFISENLKFILH